jgi:hypothetical protein
MTAFSSGPGEGQHEKRGSRITMHQDARWRRRGRSVTLPTMAKTQDTDTVARPENSPGSAGGGTSGSDYDDE